MTTVYVFMKKHIALYSKLLIGIVMCVSLLGTGNLLHAQTDTEFWFSIPETNRYHNSSNHSSCIKANDGKDVFFKFTSMELASIVTISTPGIPPGDPGYISHTFTMDPNSFREVNVGDWVNDGPYSIENRLRYSTSDTRSINRSNKGIKITATSPVTVYYEIKLPYNKDLLPLKGRNALGKLFFVPFQNRFSTYDKYPCDERQYSSFDIVATDDNTNIEITVPFRIFVWGATPAYKNAGTHTITLNKGETAIIAPYGSSTSNYKTSNTNKLAGSMVRVTSGGLDDNKIAVLTRDDLVRSSTAVDYIADQLVPIDHIGTDYALVRGHLTGKDYAYVVGTEAGTGIYVDGVIDATINAGETHEVELKNSITTIKSATGKPVYVYHLSGYGAQFAGALIPTISTCTGSSQVAFNRSTKTFAGNNFDFHLNFIVRKSAIGNFILEQEGVDVTSTVGLALGINDPANFTPLLGTYVDGGSYGDDWSYARFDAGTFDVGDAYLLKNTKDVFHLGILNGHANGDAFYGYFSNFNTFDPKSFVVETGFGAEKVCTGEYRQLYATGGTTYEWSPPDNLNFHNIPNPIAGPLLKDEIYTVTIGGACDLSDTRDVVFRVGSANPSFNADTWSACATPETLGADPSHTFTFKSNSTDDYNRTWRYRKVGDLDWVEFAVGNNTGVDSLAQATKVNLTLFNTTDNFIEYEINLAVSDKEVYCIRNLTKTVRVYPYMDINPTVDISEGCNGLAVQFSANPDPTGYYTGVNYQWEFGDGGSDNVQDPTHTYYNNQLPFTPPYDPLEYVAEVTLIDYWSVCSVKKSVGVKVHPLVEPRFTVNQIEGCSPLDATITNTSRGGITQWEWYSNSVLVSSTATPPDFSNLINSRTDNLPETFELKLVVKNNFGCDEVFTRTIRVFPNPTATINVTPRPNVNCSPLVVDFEATNIDNADSYLWSLNSIPITSNASGSYTLENPTATEQTHNFAFTANNNWGCSYSPPAVNVNVQPAVVAKIVIDNEEGCSPHTPAITNASSIGTTEWEWSIDDNGTATTYTSRDIPSQTFLYPAAKNGTFLPHEVTVTLVTRNDKGCQDHDHKTIRINPTAAASFTSVIENFEGVVLDPSIDMLCSPVYADFTGTYTNTESYEWQFGTFGGSLDPSPAAIELSNTGTSPKDVDVTLLAKNRFGCNAPIVSEIYTIQPEITAAFSMVADGSCVPVNIDVEAQPIPGATYSWSTYGDPFAVGSGTQNILIDENRTGTDQIVTIKLKVDNGSCYDISPEYTVLVHPEVEAKWDLHDGLPPSCNPYNLDINSKSTLHSTAVPINETTGYINWEVTDMLGNAITTGANDNFTRVLQNDGHLSSKTFNLSLTAKSVDGCLDTKVATIEVYPKVTPRFNVEVIEPCTPMRLKITDVSLTTTAGSIYNWGGFDGGINITQIGTKEDYEVEYNNPDPDNELPKKITLNLENSYGCTGSFEHSFIVLPQVSANFTITPSPSNTDCGDETFIFTNNSSPKATIDYYEWTFGTDKITTSSAEFDRKFTNNGLTPIDIPVSVEAFNDGCSNATAPQIITIYPKVVAVQSFEIGDICNGDVDLTLTNLSSNIIPQAGATRNFLWTFTPSTSDGTLTTSTGGSVGLINSGSINPVVYDVDFTATTIWNQGAIDERTCFQQITGNPVTVYPDLIPNYTLEPPTTRCSGQDGVTLTFTKQPTSSGGNKTDVSLLWDFGDGNTQPSDFETITHKFLNITNDPFTNPTTAIATQTATGCTAPVNVPVTVYPRVTAAQSFEIKDICNGVTIDLTNASTNKTIANSEFVWSFTTSDPGGSNVIVDFPDDVLTGVNLTNSHPTDFVTYKLNFTAQTDWGAGNVCTHSVTGEEVKVYPILNPNYDTPPAVCSDLNGANLEFIKLGTSTGGNEGDVSIQWNFSDGNTRTTGFDDKVEKLFTNLSDEDFITQTKIFATQIATGCTFTDYIDVRVHPKVESIFTFELGDVCEYPLPVTFTNASKYSKAQTGVPTQFIWDYGYDLNGNPEGETLAPINGLNHTYHFYNDKPNQIQEYEVSLTVTQQHSISGRTCENKETRTIQVYPKLLPKFKLGTTEGCNPLTVDFTNQSTGVNVTKPNGDPVSGLFEWDLGDNTSFSGIKPEERQYTHRDKTGSRNYDISLTATNPLGCVKTATTATPRVTVYPWVESAFTVDKVEGCTPLEVTLSNASKSTEYTYQWGFVGNGADASITSSNSDEPGTITFTNPLGENDELVVQKPQLTLTTSLNTAVYTKGDGCKKTATPIDVSVFPHVYPKFNAALKGCHPLDDVEFENTSNVFGGTDEGLYTWKFGNGIQSNKISPLQTYKNADFEQDKTFEGTLTAISSHGCTDLIPFQVTVWPTPRARLEMSDYMNCSPFELGITNLSVGKGKETTLAFTYNFGDGSDEHSTFSSSYFTHEYRNLNEEIEPYTLSLLVETEDGCTDETSQTIHVYPEVTTIFDTEDGIYEQCNPFEVDFTNNSKNAYSYHWDFDDGDITSSSREPRYRFVNDGIEDRIYDVKLTAMSEYDCEDTGVLPITVFAAPIVDFVIMPSHQVFPYATFNFKNRSRPGGIPTSWPHVWRFGDGNTSTSTNETIPHTYETWGKRDDDFRYEITLEIKNEKCSDFVSQKLTLLPPEPISEFDANEFRACSPLEVKFYNGSQFYFTEDGITAFEWRINNSEEPFSTEYEPSYTFTEPGYYSVGLTVYGDGGERHFFRTFRVYENPKANFEAMPERVTLPNAKVHFYNLSERADTCIWEFGNNYTSKEWDPVHTYTEMGEYRVSLTAKSLNDDGTECVDIYSKFPGVWVLGSGRIRFPNAFVPSKLGPNGGAYDAVDYKNEVFHPVAEGVTEYRLSIFNRWGEQVFESKDINIGWDGYYKGKLASQGVYVWRAVGRFANGDMFDERGNVTLLR